VNTIVFIVNFLHACNGNYSVVAARNVCVGNLVCLCVMENRSYTERWVAEGVIALKKGLCNRRVEGKIRRSKGGSSFWYEISSCLNYLASR